MLLLDSMAVSVLFISMLGYNRAVLLHYLEPGACVIRNRTHHCPYAYAPLPTALASSLTGINFA